MGLAEVGCGPAFGFCAKVPMVHFPAFPLKANDFGALSVHESIPQTRPFQGMPLYLLLLYFGLFSLHCWHLASSPLLARPSNTPPATPDVLGIFFWFESWAAYLAFRPQPSCG